MEKTAKLEAIKSWMKSNKFTQKAMAEKLGVTATVINNLLAGRVEFGLKTAEAWHEKFGIDQDFLLRGEGELFHREKTLDERISKIKTVVGQCRQGMFRHVRHLLVLIVNLFSRSTTAGLGGIFLKCCMCIAITQRP